MATATKRRRRRDPAPTGREQYDVLDNQGRVLTTQAEPSVALVRAQDKAQRIEPDSFTVVRRPLFGPTVELYRVVRDEHGTVLTYTLKRED